MFSCDGLFCYSNVSTCKTNYSFEPGWNSFVSFYNTSFITNFLSNVFLYTIFVTQPQIYATSCSHNSNIHCLHSFEITTLDNTFGIPIQASFHINDLVMSRIPYENDVIVSKSTQNYQFFLFQNNSWKNLTYTGLYLFGETMYEYHTNEVVEIVFNLCSNQWLVTNSTFLYNF